MEIGKSISIVIPAYNEAERIGPTIETIHNYFSKKHQSFDILVINDGSKDNTTNIVLDFAKGIRNVKLLDSSINQGKGSSVRKGMIHAAHDLILLTDADLSTPIEEFEKLAPWMRKGYDIVIGSRGMKESEIILRQPWYRRMMGKAFNLFVRTLIVNDFRDTQCGFKLFRSEAATRIFRLSKIDGFAFDVEVLFIAKKMGYKIKEVPVRWIDSPHSKVSALRDPFRMFLDLLKIRSCELTE
jgi:dolichyl-phosphate beta-glucosyltransferase